jgi:MazG family protein
MNPVQRLRAIMARLRDPEHGCPWDLDQDFATIAPYTIEEAYEVADAIARDDLAALRGELGDLLFQVVFHSRLAEERGAFDFDDVANAIVDKLERRHPHVFGDAPVRDVADQSRAWESHKAAERGGGALSGIARALPALVRADKMGRRAARVGFDWPDRDGPLAKVGEERAELEDALARGDDEHIAWEVGDLLLAVANLARHLGVDPEQALASANDRFEQRYAAMERVAEVEGISLDGLALDELEARWQRAKLELDGD